MVEAGPEGLIPLRFQVRIIAEAIGFALGFVEAAGVGERVHHLHPVEVIAGESLGELFHDAGGFGGLGGTAVGEGLEDLSFDAGPLAFASDALDALEAAFLVAAEAGEEADGASVPGERADDVVVGGGDEESVDVTGIEFGGFLMEAPGFGAIAQGGAPGAIDEDLVVGAMDVGDAEGIEGLRVLGVLGEAILRDGDRAFEDRLESLLILWGHGDLGTPEEAAGGGGEGGIEGSATVEGAVKNGVGEVILVMSVGGAVSF